MLYFNLKGLQNKISGRDTQRWKAGGTKLSQSWDLYKTDREFPPLRSPELQSYSSFSLAQELVVKLLFWFSGSLQ